MGHFHFELITTDEKKARVFYAEVLDLRLDPVQGSTSRWLTYFPVDDVDATAMLAAANGGQHVQTTSRILDPQGAEIALRTGGAEGSDEPFFWCELHTTDPDAAMKFYETVFGCTHKSMDSGDGPYHIIARGGADIGGITKHLPEGVTPHWLPYVKVEKPDDALTRATRHGGKIRMAAEDIPGIGRFGVLEDPTGAFLAVMKPLPRM